MKKEEKEKKHYENSFFAELKQVQYSNIPCIVNVRIVNS